MHKVQDSLVERTSQIGEAADVAAAAAFLELADRLGVLAVVSESEPFTAEQVARRAALPLAPTERLLGALAHAGLVEGPVGGPYQLSDDYGRLRGQAGFVSWASNANRPFIEHAREFFEDPDCARRRYRRDGREVAISSQWMGSLGFYDAAVDAILAAEPTHFVDLGAGSGRLLIEVLTACPNATGVALDIDAAACAAAAEAADVAGVASRLRVVCEPIQAVATRPSIVEDADVIHAGFVFHDMLPDESDVATSVLKQCAAALPDSGVMAITEAIPYAPSKRERRFSALVTYYHNAFMGRQLLGVAEWTAMLNRAGFATVDTVELAFPTGRLFLASPQ